MRDDLRFAVRTLGRSPVFTAVALVSLALGIGANTAIFSLLDQVMLRLLPVREPRQLVVFHREYQPIGMSMSDNSESVFSVPMYRDLRDRTSAFSSLFARSGSPVTVSWAGSSDRGSAEVVSGNYFQALGVEAALGRTLTPDDDKPAAPPVAVLGYGYWTRRFGARSEVLNQKIAVNGHPTLVVGIAARSFRGVMPGNTPDLFVPIAMKRAVSPTMENPENRQVRWINIFGRLKAGETLARAQAGTQAVYHAIVEDELAHLERLRNQRDRQQFLEQRISLVGAAQGINELRRESQAGLVALMAMVGLVLLIACANVANLLLARAAGRSKEIAIRLALGASRHSIVRQLMVENLALALAGGTLGLLVAGWTTNALLGILPEDTLGGWVSWSIDLRVLSFALLLSLATGLLFGLAPALQATRTGVGPALKQQSASIASGGAHARFRRALVTAQVALSLLLLIGAGLFTRSLYNLLKTDLGFRTEHVLTFSVNPVLVGYTAPRTYNFYRELRERLAALPGVEAAGGAEPGPFTHSDRGGNMTVEGYQAREDEVAGGSIDGASPGFFRALAIPLRAGREFTARDDAAAPKVVIVNEAFVKKYFAGREALGRHVAFGAGKDLVYREIVGIARDTHHGGVRDAPRPTVYLPYAQGDRPERLNFYVRTAGDDKRLAAEIRTLVRSMDASLPLGEVRSLQFLIEESLYADRLIAILSGAFGVLATLLAAIGLYGVVAYSVARRSAEIGLRMALGASARSVLWLVMKDVALLAGAGLAIGAPAAFALSRLVESQLFGLKAHDPAVFASAMAALAAVALLSGYLPGRRATRIDPIRALRYE